MGQMIGANDKDKEDEVWLTINQIAYRLYYIIGVSMLVLSCLTPLPTYYLVGQTLGFGPSKYQVPGDQESAQSTTSPEDHSSCTLPLGCSL